MADIRIKDLATTATTTASDDFMAVDGAINGTRKLSAAAPAFLTSVTTPSLTAPAATNLTLAGGTAGSDSVVVSNTLAASSAIIGAFKVGNGTAATNVSIGGGKVNIGDTTAGSSGAGALVVAGGLATGAASYFGGDVTLSKATPALNLVNTSASTFAQYLSQSTVNRALIFGQHGDSSAGTTLGIANAAGALIATATTGANYPDKLVITTIGRPAPIYFGTNNTLALTLDGTTQAATFAGAVTVNGTGTFGSSFGKVIINQWSDATNYGAITLNGNTTVAGSLGIGGGASGDSTLYFNAPTGGSIQARINGTAALTIASTSAATFAGAVTVTGALKLGNAYVAGAVVGTGSITIQDSTGTTYRIPVLV